MHGDMYSQVDNSQAELGEAFLSEDAFAMPNTQLEGFNSQPYHVGNGGAFGSSDIHTQSQMPASQLQASQVNNYGALDDSSQVSMGLMTQTDISQLGGDLRTQDELQTQSDSYH